MTPNILRRIFGAGSEVYAGASARALIAPHLDLDTWVGGGAAGATNAPPSKKARAATEALNQILLYQQRSIIIDCMLIGITNQQLCKIYICKTLIEHKFSVSILEKV